MASVCLLPFLCLPLYVPPPPTSPKGTVPVPTIGPTSIFEGVRITNDDIRPLCLQNTFTSLRSVLCPFYRWRNRGSDFSDLVSRKEHWAGGLGGLGSPPGVATCLLQALGSPSLFLGSTLTLS